MKTLPDNPNLDHLRRQAKDLLAGLRDSRPDATLADAQAGLAEQYGFRTWADLKAEVDRMQGHGDVADPTLAAKIADRFGLGRVTGAMRSVARPDEVGRLWSLETDRGRWVARTVDDVYPVTDGEDNTRFQDAAAKAGVALPAPVRSETGAPVEPIGDNQWRVYVWRHSGPPLAAPVNATVTREVGRILAVLHALRFPVAEICPWNLVRLTDTSWAELADHAAARGKTWAPVLTAAVSTLDKLASLTTGAANEDPILGHNNLNPGNVRLGADSDLVITGWEHATGIPPSWELAMVLKNWTVDPNGEVNPVGARALVAGYQAETGMRPQLELDSFHGAATGLLNYVSGQIHVALAATTADDQRYADRDVHHLLTHLPTRTTYEQILDAALTGQ
jgi:Ser/Thr protein kinase RdoA (MazF antagonist)